MPEVEQILGHLRARIFQEDCPGTSMAKAAVRPRIQFFNEHLILRGYEEIGKVNTSGGFGLLSRSQRRGRNRPDTVWNGWKKAETAREILPLAHTLIRKGARAKKNGGTENILVGLFWTAGEFAGKVEAFQLAEEPEFR